MNLARCRTGLLLLVGVMLLVVGLSAQPMTPRMQGVGLIEKIDVQHIGPPAVSDDLVRAHIRVKEGDTYSSPATTSDVRSLESTGYFRDVRVAAEATAGGYRLIYILQGKPVLTEIRFEGSTKYSRRKLLKKVDSKIGQPLDEYKLYVAAQEIQKMYQKAGYHRTRVEPVARVNEALGRATAVFVITESPKIRITDVEFVGAEAFAEKRLRRVIKTRRWWMFSWLTGSGKLKDEQFEDDKFKLLEFYQDEGYIDFELKEVTFDQTAPKRMVIRFHIFEGRQYKVGTVEFRGNETFSADQIRRGLTVLGRVVRPRMLEDDIFTPKGLEQDIQAIQDFYGARGYIGRGDASRIPVIAVKRPNIEQGTMDLVFRVEEGTESYVEKIEIQGNTRTRDKVLRRELAISPGEVFNMVRVKISQERLRGLQYFTKVETEVDPTDIPNRKNLVIGVEEGSSGSFYMGAGFSSVENLFGYVGMTQGNFDLFNPPHFTGGGQKLRLQATIGTQTQNYELRFVEPWFLGRRLALELDLYHRDIQYYSDDYTQSETGARVGLTKALWRENLIAGISYTIENIGIDFDDTSTQTNLLVQLGPGRSRGTSVVPPSISPELAQEEGDWLVSKVGYTLAYDTRAGGLLANRGQRTQLSFDLAGGPFGADVDFYKLQLQTSWYFRGPLPGHIIELIGRIGVVEPYGGSDFTHIWDRFYLGGAYTLRGYKYRDVGPKDFLDEPTGGNTFWMGSIEYSVPIIERLRFALFYDIGTVNYDAYDFDSSNYHDNWGLGLRINIPQMGPLRLDYGFPIHHDDTLSGKPRFQFSVGWSRPL
jgi:outer membrane protein insertion porin family